MSSGLESVTDEELQRRLDAVLTRIHTKCMEIAPHIKQLGDYRLEAQIIYDELHRRGVVSAYQPPPLTDDGQISLSGSDPR